MDITEDEYILASPQPVRRTPFLYIAVLTIILYSSMCLFIKTFSTWLHTQSTAYICLM